MFKLIIGYIIKSKISIFGVALTTVSAVMVLIASVLSIIGVKSGNYQALFSFTVFPSLFILGLLLIPLGIYLSHREQKRSGVAVEPFVLNFSNTFVRRGVIFFIFVTVINSIILSVALYEGYHFTDSNTFCGTLCHTVMQPEYTAHQRSPHARVLCTECHIGSGASWFVKSKLSGVRQVFAVLFNTYHRPIPSPVENLRPARETCEQCHWPEAFHGKRMRVFQSLEQEATADNPLVTALLMNIGGLKTQTGKYEGIHWHVSSQNRVEYVASDSSRLEIKRVRSYRQDGSVVEYVRDDSTEPGPDQDWRVMDCIDCHNRPTHIYDEPYRAIDESLLRGALDPTLPEIRTIAYEAITAEYSDWEQAETGILTFLQSRIGKISAEVLHEKASTIRSSASELYAIYTRNVFPRMKVTFGSYPKHIGHRNDGGCFRCHDEEHESSDGETISQDCSLCHEIVAMEENREDLSSDVRQFIE